MRFPPAPPQFTERIACVGKLSAEGRSTGSLDVLLDVSRTAIAGIRGWVLGNLVARDEVERAQGGHRGAMRLNASAGSEEVLSESVWITTTQTFGADREIMPDGLHGIACGFDCLDLTRRFEHNSGGNGQRELRFLLRGPRVKGLVNWMHEFSYDGTNRVKVLDKGRLPMRDGLPFSIAVLPHFVHAGVGGRPAANDDDEQTAEAGITSETNVLAVRFRTGMSSEAYGDETFLVDAKRAVEDICLLLSLLAGGMITWHAYSLSGATSTIQHNRSLSVGISLDRREEIVARPDLRDFLRTAFRRLRQLRQCGIDLEVPILSAVAGAQARVAQQRFGDFFLALEALHAIELERRGATFLAASREFKRVRSRLEPVLFAALRAEGLRSTKVAASMARKLVELNRPPLWDGLRMLMARLRVDWEDLYPSPPPDRPTFLKLRNVLFHSHARMDDEIVLKEAVRVEAVVHRVLLRWLGWEDLWNAPTPQVRYYVAGRALPDSHRLHGRPRRGRRT